MHPWETPKKQVKATTSDVATLPCNLAKVGRWFTACTWDRPPVWASLLFKDGQGSQLPRPQLGPYWHLVTLTDNRGLLLLEVCVLQTKVGYFCRGSDFSCPQD